jgi:glycosyltransferase involved in cell wall biosynthesis
VKILYVVHGFVPEGTGGVELHSHQLAREMARRGHDVHVFTRSGNPSREDYSVTTEEMDGFAITRVTYNFRDLKSFEGIYKNARIEERFKETLDAFRPDLVHVQHLTCLSTGIPELVRERRIPQLLTLHDFWFGCPLGQRIRRSLDICDPIKRELCVPCIRQTWPQLPWPEGQGIVARLRGKDALSPIRDYEAAIKKCLEAPDLLTTPSQFHRQKYLEYLGLQIEEEQKRIKVVPVGVPAERFQGIEKTEADHVRFGFIGTVIPTKGVHLLIEAFNRLEDKTATLDVWGEIAPYHGDTSYRAKLEGMIAPEKRDRVVFHGRYANFDVAKILASIDVLVVPSLWYESYSITIREGFLGKCCVIASSQGAMGEAIRDGVTGFQFDRASAEDLVSKMELAISQPALRQEIAKSEDKPIVTVEECAERYLVVYGDLTGL